MMIEPLESRIAPATLVNPTTVTYFDVDGDFVTVKTSLGTFSLFNNFQFGTPDGLGREQLQSIRLHNGGFGGFEYADITITVVKKPGGDGLANVGYLNSTSLPLGKVTVPGDLGRIDAGNADSSKNAIQSLSVRSMGLFGTSTQASGSSLISSITGGFGTLNVTTDVKDASISFNPFTTFTGTPGAITIGGSLIGGEAEGSGSISSKFGFASVKIGGNLIGGSGTGSGSVSTFISIPARIGSVTVGGSVVGGSASGSGVINANGSELGAVKIGGNLIGGTDVRSGAILAVTDIASVSIGGSVIGGPATYGQNMGNTLGGQIYAGGKIGPVAIAHDLRGGAGDFSGRILAGSNLGTVTIGGSIIGGAGSQSGSLGASVDMLAVKVGHDVLGGGGGLSGSIAAGTIAGVTIGGSLVGSTAASSGHVFSAGQIGPISIGQDLVGGSADSAGSIRTGIMSSVKIGGSILGGTANFTGYVEGSGISSLTIGLDLQGGSINTGAASDLLYSGSVRSTSRMGPIIIGGSLRAGIDNSSSFALVHGASIHSAVDILSLTVKGSLVGNQTGVDLSHVTIYAGENTSTLTSSSPALGKTNITGRVEHALILAGYGVGPEPTDPLRGFNPDAQIGAVTVGGDWIASSLVAGVQNSGGVTHFGDSNDLKIQNPTIDDPGINSKIASITVNGRVYGTLAANQKFGFVAEQIGALRIGGTAVKLNANSANDGFYLGYPLSMSLHEVGANLAPLVAAGKALLVNASTVTYVDSDSDRVTVKLSKPLLTAGNVDSVFKFDLGVINGTESLRTLQGIDLTPLATPGIGITVTAVRPQGFDGLFSDGLANVGYIKATGFNVGAVSIAGDLGQIDAGSGSGTAPAVASLKVRTMGRFDLTTQPASSGGFTPSLKSELLGALGSLTVTTDMKGATIEVAGNNLVKGKIGAVTVGGSMLRASISADDGIGAVKIGGDLAGGAATGTGVLQTLGAIASVTINGSLLGGTAATTGAIRAEQTSTGSIGALRIAGNVLGGIGNDNANVIAGKSLSTVNIGGSLFGTNGSTAEVLSLGAMGAVTIGHNLLGGSGTNSAFVSSSGGAMGAVTVGGSLIGRVGDSSAAFNSTGTMGAVKIGHNIRGGPGQETAKITADEFMPSVTVGGSVYGGALTRSGTILGDGGLGSVKIGHDLVGGAGIRTGAIATTDVAGKAATSVSIGGSLIGGTGGNTTAGSGEIRSLGSLGAITIGRDFLGGSITGATGNLTGSGVIQANAGRIASVSIGGSIISGLDTSTGGNLINNTTIRANDDLGALTVKGSIYGHASVFGDTPVLITARAQKVPIAARDLAIGSVTVGGPVHLANILAGFSVTGVATNANAQIGAVKVTGNWLLSNLAAGIENYGANGVIGGGDDNLNFGNIDDHAIGSAMNPISKIASITIGGVAAGSSDAGHYGFSARTIGAFKSAGFVAPLKATGARDIVELSPSTGDVTIRELMLGF